MVLATEGTPYIQDFSSSNCKPTKSKFFISLILMAGNNDKSKVKLYSFFALAFGIGKCASMNSSLSLFILKISII